MTRLLTLPLIASLALWVLIGVLACVALQALGR